MCVRIRKGKGRVIRRVRVSVTFKVTVRVRIIVRGIGFRDRERSGIG